MTDTKITWDQDADAIYIQFSVADVASTITLSSTAYINVDSFGNPVGVEILGVDASVFAALDGLSDSATLLDLIRNAA